MSTPAAIPPLPPEVADARSLLVFGGSFDPPHRGHIELPRRALEVLSCDRVLYVPAAISPFKEGEEQTPAHKRFAMIRRATAGWKEAGVWTFEIEQPGVSYTINTIQALRQLVGLTMPIRLLIGTDQAAAFHLWKDSGRILALCRPAVMLRPPETRQSLRAAMAPHWSDADLRRWMEFTLDLPEFDISSTWIRSQVASGTPARDLVEAGLDPSVADYIDEEGLYR
jgi:nicotinate-nucleotide adenylyltransferase